ncbi:MAG: hypothetical protein J6D28_05760 [Bacilli bacterium]|nr:hypothetical protein [Bacilli bacterium]
MKTYDIWETGYSDSFEYFSIEDVFNFLKKLNIDDYKFICIKNNYDGNEPLSNIEKQAKEENILINYTDKKHSFLIGKDYSSGYMIIISQEAFKKYKEKIIMEIQNNIIQSVKDDMQVTIQDFYFSNELLEKIIDAQADIILKNVNLNEQQLIKIKNSGLDITLIVDGEEKILSKKYPIGTYSQEDLKTKNEFDIYSNTLDDELQYMYLISDRAEVQIINNSKNDEEYINNLFRIIKMYNKLNKNFLLSFEIEHRRDLHNFIPILKTCSEKNLKITCDNIEYTINDYLIENEKLKSLVTNIKESNMSQLEKYFAVYNIVKKFKPYNENEKNLDQARKIKYILDNEYMVCVGYSTLLLELLNIVGIEAYLYGTVVSKYDDKANLENSGGHCRTIVNIKDDKYGIDGYFIADATWDNHKNIDDTYDYALRPFNSMQKSRDLFKLQEIDYILDNSDFNSFCLKINIILNKKINQGENLLSAYDSVFYSITNLLREIDNDKYQKLNKYIDTNEYERNEKFYEDFLTEVGHYIVSKSNKEIPPNVIATSASVAKFYGENIPVAFKEAYKDKITKYYANYMYELQNDNTNMWLMSEKDSQFNNNETIESKNKKTI